MKSLSVIINEVLEEMRSVGLYDAAFCTRTAIERLSISSPEQWAALRESLATSAIRAMVERRMQSTPDTRQGLLALPGFEKIPHVVKVDGALTDVRRATLKQYRESESELRARIKSYKYARVSDERLKRDKATLQQMMKLDRKAAPLIGKEPEATMGDAMDRIEKQVTSPMAEHLRKVAKRGGSAPRRRT